MEQQKEYYAFISYKREDEKWAKWLQDKLEHYKFPTNLNGRTDLPKNIRPTFRDVTDLSPEPLEQAINNALHNSQWLIVVCSPRSAKSPWVCKEAQTFIDLGRADHIIPFVIEGSPFSVDPATECYPDALLNLTGSKELLAANINEMGRDAAAIKVVARMFGLRFDTLWQRYERERRKRRRWIIAIISVLILAALGISGYILQQNKEIKKKNWDIMANQSRFLSEKALQLANDGDIVSALRLCIEILPNSIINPNRPYVPEAEFALRKICSMYGLTNNVMPLSNRSIRTQWINIAKIPNDKVFSAIFSSDYKYIAIASESQLQVLDVNSGNKIYEDGSVGYLETGVAEFSPNGQLIASIGWGILELINLHNREKKELYISDNPAHIDQGGTLKFSGDGKFLVTNLFWSWDHLFVFNLSDYDNIKEVIHNMDANSVDISPDSKEIALVYSKYGDSTFLLKILDIQTGIGIDSTFYTYQGKYDYVDINYDNSGDYLKIDIGNEVYNSSEDRFVKHSINTYVFGRQTLSCIDEYPGELSRSKYEHSFEERPSLYKAIVNKGEVVIQKKDKKNTYSIDSTSKLVISFDEKNATTVRNNCSTPCVWNLATGKLLYKLAGHTDTITHISYSQDNKYIATCSADSTIRVWDARTGDCIRTIQDNSPFWCEFNESSTQLLVIGQTDIFSIRTEIWERNWTISRAYPDYYTPEAFIINSEYLCSTNEVIRITDGSKVGSYIGDIYSGVNRWMVIHPTRAFIYSTSTDAGNMGGTSELYVTDFLKKTDTLIDVENHRNYDIINDIDISNNGDYFAIVSAAKNSITIYNTENNEKNKDIQIPTNSNDAFRNMKISFDKSDKYIFCLDEKELYMIEIASGQIVEHFTGFCDFQLSPMGNYLILHDSNGNYSIISRHSLQSLINISKKLFKDNPLTPEERKKYYLE